MSRLKLGLVLALFASVALAHGDDDRRVLETMPVKEVIVFKDGHAFCVHEGRLPVDRNGNVVMDELPKPVLGTFWPYDRDGRCELEAVTAGRRRVEVARTALEMRDLIEANIGAQIFWMEGKEMKSGRIVDVPKRTVSELNATNPAGTQPAVAAAPGKIVLIETPEGVRSFNLNRLQDVTFKSAPKTTRTFEETRDVLTMRLSWDGAAGEMADVGMAYLQKGLRWIPNYRVSLEGESARIELQATLINELVNLDGADLHLVIGVPSFAFADTLDPISLQNTMARLSPYMYGAQQQAYGSNFLSNGIMTQTARMGEHRGAHAPAAAPNLGPDIGGAGKSEDLFVFTIKDVKLGRGERMVVPVTSFEIPYRDVYTLVLPFGPPKEFNCGLSSQQQQQLARLLASPRVEHQLRLQNTSSFPLTTAPALIFSGAQPLGQGMITYTAPGGTSDLTVTKSVDIRVSRRDVESERQTNAVKLDGYSYSRVDLQGSLMFTNYSSHTVELEIVRYVLGATTRVGQDGTSEMINMHEDAGDALRGVLGNWSWSRMPSWWPRLNGVTRMTWKKSLEAGKSMTLEYDWHYFWR